MKCIKVVYNRRGGESSYELADPDVIKIQDADSEDPTVTVTFKDGTKVRLFNIGRTYYADQSGSR